MRVYWSDKKSVTVEQNVYYDRTSASRPEGEIDGIIGTKANTPAALNMRSVPSSSQTSEFPASATLPRNPSSPPAAEPVPDEPPTEKRVRKPSQCVADLLEGHGRTSNCPSDPVVTPGIQAPIIIAEEPNRVLEGEGQSDWMMWADFTTNLVEEYAMAAEIGDAEALEPQTLAEAKRCPDWPLWEKAINEELETLRQAGTWELTEAPSDANIVGSKWVF